MHNYHPITICQYNLSYSNQSSYFKNHIPFLDQRIRYDD